MLSNILKKSSPLLASNLFSAIMTLISAPLLLNSLGLDGYGVYVALFSVIQIVNAIFNIQSWQALVNYWYRDGYKNKKDALLKKCISVDFFSALLGALVILLTLKPVIDLIGLDVDLRNELYITSIAYVFFSQTSFSIGVFRCLDKFSLHAKLISLFSLFRLIAVIIAVFLEFTPQNALIISLVMVIFLNIVQFFVAFKLINFSFLKIKRPYEKVEGFTKYSIWVNLKVVADLPITHLDKVIVTTFLGSASLALYDLLKKCSSLIGMVASPIGQVVLPYLTNLVESGNSRKAYVISFKYGLLAFIFLTPVFLIFSSLIMFFDLNEIIGVNDYFFYSASVYVGAQILASSFVMIHVLFMALGLVKKDFLFLVLSNAIYLMFCVVWVEELQIMAFSLGFFTQAIMVIIYKLYQIRKEVMVR